MSHEGFSLTSILQSHFYFRIVDLFILIYLKTISGSALPINIHEKKLIKCLTLRGVINIPNFAWTSWLKVVHYSAYKKIIFYFD